MHKILDSVSNVTAVMLGLGLANKTILLRLEKHHGLDKT